MMKIIPRYDPMPEGVTLEEWARYSPYRSGHSHRVLSLGPDLFAVDYDAAPGVTHLMSGEELVPFIQSLGVAPIIEPKRRALQDYTAQKSRQTPGASAEEISSFLSELGL